MTGGAASVAFAKEESFMGALVDSDSNGTPEYYSPGRNIQVQELELSNALQRMRVPDDVESVESLAQNLEGALAVSAVVSADTQADVHDIIFNNAGTGFKAGAAATSRWFMGVNHLNGTAERELLGCTPTDYSIEYQQGQVTRHTLTMIYADEQKNTSITPSSIVRATDGSSVAHHGVSLDVNAAAQTKLQSATMSISNIARFQRGPSRKALDAVIAAPQTALTANAIFGGSEQLELAYGSSGATSPEDLVGGVNATLTLDSAGGTNAATYSMSNVTPDTYAWTDLVNGDADLKGDVNYHVNGVTA